MPLFVDIKKQLGNFRLAVKFEVNKDIFALLGASGCGKSMTLKCIAGIETPDEGKIILNDKILFDSGKRIDLPPQKRNVGYMFQDYALFPNMTVTGNIMAGMKGKKDPDRASSYIERFRLFGLEDHYPGQLSGGQKQRTAMARMMAAEPDVILLDEPFSALDSYLKWELEEEMLDLLADAQKPVLFVSHDRDEVYRMSRRVGCINKGKMEAAVDVREFFKNPGTVSAALLSGCKNISRAVVKDGTHVWASDWNTMLEVKAGLSEEEYGTIKAVGIRAHSFSVPPYGASEPEAGQSRILAAESHITEAPFEWNISFRNGINSKWLQWKVPKSGEEKISIPKYLEVSSENIFLLRE